MVAKKLGVSRSSATNLIKAGRVKVGGLLKKKSATRVDENSPVQIEQKEPSKASKLRLNIIYEDDNCVVVDKPAGVLSHSKGAFSEESTIASWLWPKTSGFKKDNNRAGIVHRLDRGTSGVMICAKNPRAMQFLQKQFGARKVSKKYIALVQGLIEPREAIIDIPIERNPKDPKFFKVSSGGKPAKTAYKTIKTFTKEGVVYSLLELSPKTGRTHQLRVHLKHMKRPILGDDFYGGAKADRLYLHARELSIGLPDNNELMTFSSDLPAGFSQPKI